MKVLTNVKIYTGTDVITDGFIRYDSEIQAIGSMKDFQQESTDVIESGTGQIVIPGMIDVHIHGGHGIDTMDADSDKLALLGKKLMMEGVTTFFPTTMTQSVEAINEALKACKEAKEKCNSVGGVHLEGPFVNLEWKGAQPAQYIIPPDVEQFEKWQKISGDLISLVTFAPEVEGGEQLKKHFEATGVIGSCGHTGAFYDDLKNSNVSHATHLYNQMRGLHHREPGVVGYALLTPGVKVEIIADGIHICPEMVKLAYKLKGPKEICLITDAMRAKGLEEGMYELGGQPVKVEKGKATLTDGTIAGSILTMDQAFRNMIEFTGCSIEEAVQMTSVNQAEEFGLTNKGELAVGKDADFVVMNEKLFVKSTIQLGKSIDEVTI